MISVIIPVYNTAKFLSTCIKSVINQTFQELEIIIVNDASTDNSIHICNKFKEKDNRIILIDKKENEGVEFTVMVKRFVYIDGFLYFSKYIAIIERIFRCTDYF